MISGFTSGTKSSLIIDLEIGMSINHPSSYDKNYDNRES
jgi:hypothetical protein